MHIPELVAHRGYPAHYPENTLPGICAALEAGARYIEVDVQLSADGEPVLFHDRDMQRLCGQSGAIHDYTAQTLRTCHVSDSEHFGDRFAQTPLATLAGLVELVKQQEQVTVFIEIKRISIAQFGRDLVVEKVIAVLTSMHQRFVIISYDIDSLQLVRDRWGWSVGAIVDNWADREQAKIIRLQPEYLFCDIQSLPAEGKLAFLHSKLVVFECTDPQLAVQVAKRGIDYVETFAFAEMHAQLEFLSLEP